MRTGRPSTSTRPEVARSAPKIIRTSSVRPAPTRPGDAEDVACADREARVLDDAGPAEALDAQELLARRSPSPAGSSARRVTAALLPGDVLDQLAAFDLAVGASKTILPSRMTATSSVMSKTSCSRWVT